MTITEKQHATQNYYISLEAEKGNNGFHYSVKVYPICGGICGYPMRECSYPIQNKKKAYATYARYKRKYK